MKRLYSSIVTLCFAIAFLGLTVAHAQDAQRIQYINDAALPKPNGYNHVTVAPAGKQIYISGQVSYDSNGNMVLTYWTFEVIFL